MYNTKYVISKTTKPTSLHNSAKNGYKHIPPLQELMDDNSKSGSTSKTKFDDAPRKQFTQKTNKKTPLGVGEKRQHGEQKGVGRGLGVGVGGACRLAWSPVAAVERAGSAPFPGLGLLRPKLPKIATHTQPALRRQEQQVYSLSPPPLSLSLSEAA